MAKDVLKNLAKLDLFDDYDQCGKKGRIPIPKGVEKRAYNRAQGKCEMDGTPFTDLMFEIHHIDHNPANNNLNNLMVLCPNCHARKHFHDYDKPKKKAKDKGFTLANPFLRKGERPLF